MKRPHPPQKSGLPPKKRPGRSPAPGKGKPDTQDSEAARLQKFMARAGVGSRRHCEELITSGRVEIDGRTVTELGTKVQPGQSVSVDGTPIAHGRLLHYLVNKPTGVVSTNYDPSGRPRVIDLLPPTDERLFTVGRLDMSSEGLILVTNDGELANRLAHPRYGVEKTYQVVVAGTPSAEVFESLRKGVHLAEGLARVTRVRVKKTLKQSTVLEIVLSEGKNREIRRILAKVGHKVLRLRRIAIGPLRLAEMVPGEWRRLTSEELRALRTGHKKRGPERKRAAAHARPHLRPGGVREEPKPGVASGEIIIRPGLKKTGTILMPDAPSEAGRQSRPRRPGTPTTPKPGKPRHFSRGAAQTPRERSETRGPARPKKGLGTSARHKRKGRRD